MPPWGTPPTNPNRHSPPINATTQHNTARVRSLILHLHPLSSSFASSIFPKPITAHRTFRRFVQSPSLGPATRISPPGFSFVPSLQTLTPDCILYGLPSAPQRIPADSSPRLRPADIIRFHQTQPVSLTIHIRFANFLCPLLCFRMTPLDFIPKFLFALSCCTLTFVRIFVGVPSDSTPQPENLQLVYTSYFPSSLFSFQPQLRPTLTLSCSNLLARILPSLPSVMPLRAVLCLRGASHPQPQFDTRERDTARDCGWPCAFYPTFYPCVCFYQNVHDSIESLRPPSSNAPRPLPAH